MVSCTSFPKTWVERELAGCDFRDARLRKRFQMLLQQIGSDVGQSIPLVCQDWANTKAAYRFFSNDRVSEADILMPLKKSNGTRCDGRSRSFIKS
jgi:hypothetical protein